MIYLGLDLGSKTLGLSKSETGIIATSYKTLRFEEAAYNKMYQLLKTEINEIKPDVIVLGNPKNMNNTIGEKSILSINLKDKINLDFPKIKVYLEDERMTTIISNKIMSNLKKSVKFKKANVDSISAEIILQSFLDKINNK